MPADVGRPAAVPEGWGEPWPGVLAADHQGLCFSSAGDRDSLPSVFPCLPSLSFHNISSAFCPQLSAGFRHFASQLDELTSPSRGPPLPPHLLPSAPSCFTDTLASVTPRDEQQFLQDFPPRPSVVSASLRPSPLHSSGSFPLRNGLSEICEQTIQDKGHLEDWSRGCASWGQGSGRLMPGCGWWGPWVWGHQELPELCGPPVDSVNTKCQALCPKRFIHSFTGRNLSLLFGLGR